MNNITKTAVGIIVVALIIWGIAASRKENADPGANIKTENDTYKIGVSLPLTGDAASYGEPALKVMRIAAEKINNQGGIKNKKIELVVEDDKCSGKDGSSAAQKLININKVQVILGSMCSSATLAEVPIIQANKVLLFSPGASSPKLTGISPYFFRNYPSDSSQGKVDAEIAYTKGFRKVAFIVESKDYPLGIYQSFLERFTELGGQTVKEEFSPESTDFKSQLSKLKTQNPDALFIDPQAPAAAERIIKQIKNLGWKPQLFISETQAGDPKFLSANKEAVEGALGAEFLVNLQDPRSIELLRSYKEKYDEDLPYQSYGHTEYDALYLLKDGIEKVGYNGEKLATWSRTIKDWDGASGKITIKPDGDRESGYSPEIVENGKMRSLSQ